MVPPRRHPSLSLPRFAGGGIVLGYRCQSRCQHCLYGCGPHRRDGKPTPEELERLLDTLVRIAPYARYHIGGGEPFLDIELLARTISSMQQRGLRLEYVETNAGWVKDGPHAEAVLRELAGRGLTSVLVSVSPFHAQYVPLAKTKMLIDTAQRLLRHGPFVWIPEFLAELGGRPETERLDLDALIADRGPGYGVSIADRYGLIPGGRAGSFYARHGRRQPWRELCDRPPCAHRLADTSHFHVDGQGRYVPGLCAGLILPLDRLSGPLELADYPVIDTLMMPGGLSELTHRAIELGFAPQPTYSAPCHLCTEVRRFLFFESPSADLGPAGYYRAESLDNHY